MSAPRASCFVVMPFSKSSESHTAEYWTRHFEDFLKPVLEQIDGLEVRRSQAMRGDVLRQIVSDLVASQIVLVELTDANANVYWELGVRQSFRHGTVTIAEEGTRLPFDISVKGTLFYKPSDHVAMEAFRKQLQEAMRDCISNPDKPDSHVLESIYGRGTLFEAFRKDEAIRRIVAVETETIRNIGVVEEVAETIESNEKARKSATTKAQPSSGVASKATLPAGHPPAGQAVRVEFVTNRLRLRAMDLLLTTRYLDEPAKFYEDLDECSENANVFNQQLALWELSGRPTEAWLKSDCPDMLGTLKKALKNIQEAKARIIGIAARKVT